MLIIRRYSIYITGANVAFTYTEDDPTADASVRYEDGAVEAAWIR